ncbi:MAG: hypothetical protein Q7R66_21505 [Undibacterium sp.]|uniref:hypothetical protein n=1 Tax=Undibacterium sp. TaxID=1914977 RepID=UPI00271DF1F6|nr:hypothetical protein [Undibacterium sp.]MDO8654755.1 hypothetical protein [Undibacterium sp.]
MLNLSDRYLDMINAEGRLVWQEATCYCERALIETNIGRSKSAIGPRLWARGFEAHQTEVAIGLAALNRMQAAGYPNYVRCKREAALLILCRDTFAFNL